MSCALKLRKPFPKLKSVACCNLRASTVKIYLTDSILKKPLMKAIARETYGTPDVLQLKEIDLPEPGPEDLLVKVHTVSVNPADWYRMAGIPLLIRLKEGLFRPSKQVVGCDVAGTVTAVGADVTRFKVGDAVFGDISHGGFAEYACAKADLFAHMPDNVTFEQAAATPVAGLTALQGLRDKGGIQAGMQVLINGASGGVGTFAVQIAKAYGATVTAVCSTRNVEMVRGLGADQVIDYQDEDFREADATYDLIFDAVGNVSAGQYKRLLKHGGTGVIVGINTAGDLIKLLATKPFLFRKDSRQVLDLNAHANDADMATLAEMLESGAIKAVIDQRYAFGELPDALRYVRKGRSRGKNVVRVVAQPPVAARPMAMYSFIEG